MINSIQFLNGFPTQWAHIGNRVFEFKEGLNILFGDVGSGKSTVAKTLAAYSGIDKGGWQQINEPAKLATKMQSQFPWLYRQFSPNHIDAKVIKSGDPVFYYDSELMGKGDMTWFFQNASQSADGISTEAEQMDIITTKPSSGQYRVHKINKIMQLIKNPPNLTIIPPHITSDRIYAQMEIDYIKALPKGNKATLILDEPERGLNIIKQIELFEVFDKLAEYFQVIAVTHCPFILFRKNTNIIDMQTGYSKMVKDLIKKNREMINF